MTSPPLLTPTRVHGAVPLARSRPPVAPALTTTLVPTHGPPRRPPTPPPSTAGLDAKSPASSLTALALLWRRQLALLRTATGLGAHTAAPLPPANGAALPLSAPPAVSTTSSTTTNVEPPASSATSPTTCLLSFDRATANQPERQPIHLPPLLWLVTPYPTAAGVPLNVASPPGPSRHVAFVHHQHDRHPRRRRRRRARHPPV